MINDPQALHGDDRYLRLLFRQLPGAVWATDRALCLTYIVGRLANNMSPRARPGLSLYAVLDTRNAAHPIIASHLAAIAGEPQSFEYQVNNRWYAVFIEQLVTDNGLIAGAIGAAFDITEQRATQERLASREALLAQAQRVAHIGSFEWEVASNVVVWSDELYRIYGVAAGRFTGTYEGFLERIHPDDLAKTKLAIFDALRTGSPFVYEHRIVRSDGGVRVLHTRGEVVVGADHKAIRMIGSCWDVTELKEAMDHVERARSLLAAAIDATADGLLIVDLQGNVKAYNKRFLSLWQIPQDLIRQNSEKVLAHLCDQLKDPAQSLSCGREIYRDPQKETFDVQHLKDGRVFERYSMPQRIGEQIVGRVWSFRDITERDKLLRRALFLADATRLLGSLNIEPALEGVARIAVPFMGEGCAIHLVGNGHSGPRAFFSGIGAATFGPEPNEGMMMGHSTIYSIGIRSCMSVPMIVKGNIAGAMTFVAPPMQRYSTADLEFAESLARRAALSVENAGLFTKAQKALRARDEFLTIAAHEIRGPITSIHLAVQGMKNGRVPASAMAKMLDVIEHEDRRLARFVTELLDLEKIQHGQMYFNLEDVDLGSVVREAASRLSTELARSGSALSIVTEGRPIGHWDKHKLNEVATSLLSNAIKFGAGKPIAVAVREHDGYTALSIEDHGIGIERDMLDLIFKPFERAVSVRNYGGLGLGLFIARTIVEGLGGTIRVQSTVGEGSTFTVELKNVRA